MTMGGIIKRYGVAEACAMALEASADLVLMKAQNHLVEDTFNAIRSFVESGRITIEELDSADKDIIVITDTPYEETSIPRNAKALFLPLRPLLKVVRWSPVFCTARSTPRVSDR